VFRGPEGVSVASRGLCFMCVIQKHDQTPEQPWKRTRSAARDTTHMHTHTHRHHKRLPRTHEMHGISYSVSHILAVNLMSELLSCSSHSAFSDTKYCWFLLASNIILKNPLLTGDVY